MPIIIFVVFAGIWLLNQAMIRSQLAMFSREVARECGIKYNNEWKGSLDNEAIKYCIQEKAEQEIFQKNQITKIKFLSGISNERYKAYVIYAPGGFLPLMGVEVFKTGEWLNCKAQTVMHVPLKKLPRLIGESDADSTWWSKVISIIAEGSAKIETAAADAEQEI